MMHRSLLSVLMMLLSLSVDMTKEIHLREMGRQARKLMPRSSTHALHRGNLLLNHSMCVLDFRVPPLEDSIKISIANAIAVNITSAFGDALVKYQREDQKLVSAGSASDLTILPSSNKMQSNHSMTESNSNESLVSNSNAPLLKNDLRRSIYVRYQHSSKEDIIEVVPGDCITMDEEANSTILSTLDEDREPPDSRISNKIVDGYLRPTLAALSKSK